MQGLYLFSAKLLKPHLSFNWHHRQDKSLPDTPTSYSLKVKVLVAQSGPTFCNPMDCSPPGSSVRGILQARILEWVAMPFSRGSSLPRDWTQGVCIAGRLFITEPSGKPLWHKAVLGTHEGVRFHGKKHLKLKMQLRLQIPYQLPLRRGDYWIL